MLTRGRAVLARGPQVIVSGSRPIAGTVGRACSPSEFMIGAVVTAGTILVRLVLPHTIHVALLGSPVRDDILATTPSLAPVLWLAASAKALVAWRHASRRDNSEPLPGAVPLPPAGS